MGKDGIGEIGFRFVSDGGGEEADHDPGLPIDRIGIDGTVIEPDGQGIVCRDPPPSAGAGSSGPGGTLASDTGALDPAPRPAVAENAPGAVIGRYGVTDPGAGEVFVLDIFDDRSEVVDGMLELRDEVALDREGAARIDVRVTFTCSAGNANSQDVSLAIAIADAAEAPTDIALDAATVTEGARRGAAWGI